MRARSPLRQSGPAREGGTHAPNADPPFGHSLTRAQSLILLLFCALLIPLLSVLLTPHYGDYPAEIGEAARLLLAGKPIEALLNAPIYGGSLLLRAPAMLPVSWLGGSELQIYRAGAFLFLALLGLLAWGLVRIGRREGVPLPACLAMAALFVLTPALTEVLKSGHPEDVLAIGALLLAWLSARSGRPVLSGLFLILAVGAKPWALLGAGPVMLALGGKGLLRYALTLIIPLLGGLLGLLLLDLERGVLLLKYALLADHFWYQTQLWWIFSPENAPRLVIWLAHPLILFLPLLLSLLLLLRLGARRAAPHALALLAFCLLLRCYLDPWNNLYYAMPASLALATWQVLERGQYPTVALAWTLGSLAAFYINFGTLLPGGVVWLAYTAVVCLTGLLAWRAWQSPPAGLASPSQPLTRE